MTTVALSKFSAYDRTMQWFGGMWFMLLALGVATKVGSSVGDPWPSLLSSFCLAAFYVLLALLIITRPPAKAHANGLLPRLAAFVGTYMPWTIAFFGESDKALPNLASTACVLIGMIMMLVTIRHLGRSFSLVPQARNVVQTGPYRWIKHPLYLAEEIAVLGVDRKSTRLNSSHVEISYAVFCLKKKKKGIQINESYIIKYNTYIR